MNWIVENVRQNCSHHVANQMCAYVMCMNVQKRNAFSGWEFSNEIHVFIIFCFVSSQSFQFCCRCCCKLSKLIQHTSNHNNLYNNYSREYFRRKKRKMYNGIGLQVSCFEIELLLNYYCVMQSFVYLLVHLDGERHGHERLCNA